MVKNVYFDNKTHDIVVETGRGDNFTETVIVNGKEYSKEDFNSIVLINNKGYNEYKLFWAENNEKCVITHYSNYNGIVTVTVDTDKSKYHGESDKSLLRTLEDDDLVTFSWNMGFDVEHDTITVIGINENGVKIGFGKLVEYGIEDGYKYARYAAYDVQVEGFITSFYGYADDKSKKNTDYNFNVKRAAWGNEK